MLSRYMDADLWFPESVLVWAAAKDIMTLMLNKALLVLENRLFSFM